MKEKINVLYISTLCSERLISEMLSLNLGFPNLAAQKFHRLFAQGMALNIDLFNVNVLSVPEYQKSINSDKVIFKEPETEAGVLYRYVPIILIPIVKRIVVVIYLFAKIVKWRLTSKYKKNLIIFDILNLSTSIVSLFVSKILRIKSVAIVTDLPSLMYVLQEEKSVLDKLSIKLQNGLLSITNGYVFLTEAMNETLNQEAKPYCIIEGLSDIQLFSLKNDEVVDTGNKVFHYSGGLYEKFGVKALIDAFMQINRDDIRLHLFGNGELTSYIELCIEKDSRIVFFGYKKNEEVLHDQLNSLVLLNPRFTHEDYTKYSFPSKTMEYMASGIPLLTTRLPGIPKEYFDFVYVFEEENVEGYRRAMERILDIPKIELKVFGDRARNFVLQHKNNKVQAEKFYRTFDNL
jgi:glycosyltransferase involved in cell wall biosynthesis